MAAEKKTGQILENALGGKAPSREECESSREAFAVRAAAAGLIREKTGSAAVMYGQYILRDGNGMRQYSVSSRP